MPGFTTRTLQQAEAPEQATNGHSVTPPRFAIAERLEGARRELQLASEIAQQSGEEDTYIWLRGRIGEIDAKRSVFAEREAAND